MHTRPEGRSEMYRHKAPPPPVFEIEQRRELGAPLRPAKEAPRVACFVACGQLPGLGSG